MSNTSRSSSNGIGFVGLLTIVFIVLKITKYIDWSWWWVVSPIWISFSIAISVVVLIFVGAVLYEMNFFTWLGDKVVNIFSKKEK